MAIMNRTRPWYLDRHKTASALRSMWKLFFLSEEHMERFLDSYDVFSMEWEERLADNPEDFRETSRKVGDWYSVVNLLCAIGQIEKMYIPPRLDAAKGVHANQILFERMLAEDLRVGPGDTVLELGCGRGRVAHHVHSLTGAALVGFNVDESDRECERLRPAAPGRRRVPLPTARPERRAVSAGGRERRGRL